MRETTSADPLLQDRVVPYPSLEAFNANHARLQAISAYVDNCDSWNYIPEMHPIREADNYPIIADIRPLHDDGALELHGFTVTHEFDGQQEVERKVAVYDKTAKDYVRAASGDIVVFNSDLYDRRTGASRHCHVPTRSGRYQVAMPHYTSDGRLDGFVRITGHEAMVLPEGIERVF